MSPVFPRLFAMFLISGFCGLLYQVVWLRLAFAGFGVITPVISVVVSVFMAGLALGSWWGGRWAEAALAKKFSPLKIYAFAEVLIGGGAFFVPLFFAAGGKWLAALGETNSGAYLFWSALMIAGSLIPWCFAMGLTYPLVMAYARPLPRSESSFSYLYLANVIGAMLGAGLTAGVLIELLGFQNVLWIGAALNFAIALLALQTSSKFPLHLQPAAVDGGSDAVAVTDQIGFRIMLLFFTGFSSMAMEVIWTRAFTRITQTTIYAFALLLVAYLAATWVGSWLYRRHLRAGKTWDFYLLLLAVSITSFWPLLVNDPRLNPRVPNVLIGIMPFCLLLGYMTPQLIDQLSGGNGAKAGRIYAVNILGSILGPLAAGYILLPWLGVKLSLVLVAVPFVLFLLMGRAPRAWKLGGAALCAALALIIVGGVQSFEDPAVYKNAVIRRDHTATVIAAGEGMHKKLFVNGVGITELTSATKVMAHLPLATLNHAPESALVICFGMGTTFKSLLSWGIESAAVELVPSVKDLYFFFHPEAEQLLADPKGEVIVDDGRRYLRRSEKKFDLITLDPPPPVEAAGSSLLYSTGFYEDVKKRLKPGGILQQWLPGGEAKIVRAVTASLQKSFPHIVAYRSLEGWGFHFIASETPFQIPNAEQFIAKLPPAALADLMEWMPDKTPAQAAEMILSKGVPLEQISPQDDSQLITDTRPYNEYFLLRRSLDKLMKRYEYWP